jgi:hypothetical protein
VRSGAGWRPVRSLGLPLKSGSISARAQITSYPSVPWAMTISLVPVEVGFSNVLKPIGCKSKESSMPFNHGAGYIEPIDIAMTPLRSSWR